MLAHLKRKFVSPDIKIKALEMLRRVKLINCNTLPACDSLRENQSNTDRTSTLEKYSHKKNEEKRFKPLINTQTKHIWALVYPTSPQNSEISVGFKNCKSTFFTSLMQCQNNNFKQHQVRGISQNLDHFCLSYFHICCFSAQWMIDPWNNKGQTVRYWYYKLHWQNTKGSNKAYNHFHNPVLCNIYSGHIVPFQQVLGS